MCNPPYFKLNEKSSLNESYEKKIARHEIMIDIEGVFVNPIHYCVFKKEVAQYWGDNLGDPHGNVSTLYQEIAKDIFGESGGVIFCTDNK